MKIRKTSNKKNQERQSKKALSPVIATVLLIAIVVVIAVIIFLWFGGITEEVITKFGKKNIKLVCNDVQFRAGYNAGTGALSLSNTGNVPIYSISIQMSSPGQHITKDLKNMNAGWPDLGVNQGEAFLSTDIGDEIPADTNEMLLVPILLGKEKKGAEKTHTCEETQGYKISL